MNRTLPFYRLAIGLGMILVSQAPLLFRRDRNRQRRVDAFRDLFAALAALYESVARLRPEWRDNWRDRRNDELPPKYEFGDDVAVDAAYDVRFATSLLQRYRWKSVVRPLFDDIEEPSWRSFSSAASQISPALLAIADTYADKLREDEIDWINTAVEQLDEASRRRRRASDSGTPRSQQIAEGAYQPIYIAIQLSERLIERLRYEAADR